MDNDIKIDSANVVHAASDLRKAVEIDAKSHINKIWHSLDNAALWPLNKLEALMADLKKHL